jgi:hypothetical protein
MLSLIEEIRGAFASCPRPPADEVTESGCCAECDELAAALRDRSWQEEADYLAAQDWDPDPSYLLKPAAFRYFAPAYLLAALLPSPSTDTEARLFRPSYAFAPSQETAESFTTKYRDAFAPAERRAIVNYLRFLADRDSEEGQFARARINRALDLVWEQSPGCASYGA